jgi:hypothetical protein
LLPSSGQVFLQYSSSNNNLTNIYLKTKVTVHGMQAYRKHSFCKESSPLPFATYVKCEFCNSVVKYLIIREMVLTAKLTA